MPGNSRLNSSQGVFATGKYDADRASQRTAPHGRRMQYDTPYVIPRCLTYTQKSSRYRQLRLRLPSKTGKRLNEKDRREVLTARLFKRQVLASSSLLHYLLPHRRDNDTILSLRNPRHFHTHRAPARKSSKNRSHRTAWITTHSL